MQEKNVNGTYTQLNSEHLTRNCGDILKKFIMNYLLTNSGIQMFAEVYLLALPKNNCHRTPLAEQRIPLRSSLLPVK